MQTFMQRSRAAFLGALACAALLGTALPVPAAAEAPSDGPIPPSSFAYGAILNNLPDAPLARDAGFNLMSAYVSWKSIEPNRGQFIFEQKDQWGRTQANDLTNVLSAAQNAGLKFGLRLDDPPDWAGGAAYRLDPADVEDYVYHVVHYAGPEIAYVEVFNEMNLPLEWGTSPVDPAAYSRILAGAYRGAKRANPGVTVVSAAPSQRTGGLGGTMEDVDWLNALYDAGGSASFDALGMHAYLGNFDPNTDPSCTPMCFRDLELYRAVMEARGDSGKRALITEFGTLEQAPVDLGPYQWMQLPSETRAAYLVQALHMATTQYTWLIGATVFNLDYASNMPSGSERGWFSLLNADKSPRLAYTRFQQARGSGFLP
jgi:polysaccharide biosynthesis protein PslG